MQNIIIALLIGLVFRYLLSEPKNKKMEKRKFTSKDVVSFGDFIRDNFFVTGAPKLASYNTQKYPSSSISEIFILWEAENEKTKKDGDN